MITEQEFQETCNQIEAAFRDKPLMTEQDFIQIIEEYIERFNAWEFTDPKKKKSLKVKRKKRLFTKKQKQ